MLAISYEAYIWKLPKKEALASYAYGLLAIRAMPELDGYLENFFFFVTPMFGYEVLFYKI